MDSDSNHESAVQKRVCPVPNCDSSGHADGVSPCHFLVETCPKYLGLTLTQCQQIRSRLDRRSCGNFPQAIKSEDDTETGGTGGRSLRSRAKLFKRERWSPDTDRRNRLPILYDENVFKELKVRAAQLLSEEDQLCKSFLQVENRNELPADKQYLVYSDNVITAPTCKHDSDKMRASTVLYFCDGCLRAFTTAIQFSRHKQKCLDVRPPGRIIYEHQPDLCLFEIDAAVETQYCQNVCIFARRFLSHKTVYEHVQPFQFYLLACRESEDRWKMVGYFSKMKVNDFDHNLSCLVVLPPFMGRGYGTLLIDCSYKMSQREQRIGTPERPLTDFGLSAYRSYWTEKLFRFLLEYKESEYLNIQSIAKSLFIHPNDIVETLQYHGLVKSYKGRHIVLKDVQLMSQYLDQKSAKRTYNCFVDVNKFEYEPMQVLNLTDDGV